MARKGLAIWVKESKDKRFFDKVVKPEFEKKYDFVEVREWAKEKNKKVEAYIQFIQDIGADYIFVADIDESPCITKKKQKITSTLKNIDKNKIIIVKKGIGSWYLAGLDANKCSDLKIKHYIDTEKSNEQISEKFSDEVSLMIEILEQYCPDTAKQQNNSFKYFVDKYKICS